MEMVMLYEAVAKVTARAVPKIPRMSRYLAVVTQLPLPSPCPGDDGLALHPSGSTPLAPGALASGSTA